MAIHDKDVQMTAVITDLLVSDPLLGRKLQRQWQGHAAVNTIHLLRLDKIAL